MNCPNCQRPVKPNEKFCRSCGCKLIQLEAEAAQVAENEASQVAETFKNEVSQTSQPWENEIPQASETFESEVPQTSQPWETETPQTFESEVPQTSQPWESEIPQTSQTFESEVPQTSQPDAQPPKKKSKLPMIIIIAVVAAVLIGAGVFCAIYFLGGNKGGQNSGGGSASQSDTVPTEAADEQKLSELVEKYEKAVNDSDKEALEKLFLPSKKEELLVTTETLTAINELVKQTGQKINYKIVLQDGVDIKGDNAQGKLKLTVAIPIIGEQSTESDIRFQKQDGVWYISKL